MKKNMERLRRWLEIMTMVKFVTFEIFSTVSFVFFCIALARQEVLQILALWK